MFRAATVNRPPAGAGPRSGWLKAEARHESAFRHWKTTATAAPVRHQGHARGEAKVFG